MTVKKKIDFLRQNFIFYLAGILVILGIKYYYSQAACDSLLWILAPTTRWVEFLSRIPFTYISGTGYVNHGLRLLIAPSCSGVRFMIIAFATMYFSFVHMIALPRKSAASDTAESLCEDSAAFAFIKTIKENVNIKRNAKGLSWLVISMFLSWMFTIFVNGLRIIIAIYLPVYLENAGVMKGVLTQDRLHTVIGVVVYFTALLTIYRLVGWFVQRAAESDHTYQGNSASPVFWYFALTLGLPFLNRAGRDGTAGFAEFAVLVTGCCGLILLLYAILFFLRRQK